MGEYFQRPPLMVFSVPKEIGTPLENYTLEEIQSAFMYHEKKWEYDYREIDSNISEEKIPDTVMEPLVLRYRVLH